MQEQTPVPNRKTVKKTTKKPAAAKRRKQPVAKPFKQFGNNPYAGVPVKTNSMVARKSSNQVPTSGFGFAGSVY
jgi:hypothetical protein